MNRTIKFLTTFFFVLFCVFVYGLHLNAMQEIADATHSRDERCKNELKKCLKGMPKIDEQLDESYRELCVSVATLCTMQ